MNKYSISAAGFVIFAAGFLTNGYRWDAKYQALEVAHLQQESARKDENMEAVLDNQKHVLYAIQNWQLANGLNEKAYAELNKTVLDMRATVSGLRFDTKRFSDTATQTQLRAYAEACTAVFHTMAAEIAELGEEGARIARQADRHAADEELIGQKP